MSGNASDLSSSGSDDKLVNIHRYQPDDSTSQFKHATSIATGHTANIFSVKFMPYCNDQTVVSCAGDGQVRIFDLEYAGRSGTTSAASTVAASRQQTRNNVIDGVKYLSDGNTNCRVFRSHEDRVKRIVIESSPYYFLTCSEDGEVRQWDTRQPSSFYPAQHGNRSRSTTDAAVPAPLISYKRYDMELNTISCTPSQPHYIALGGSHLHVFLHDRRMIGRDRLEETGRPLPSASSTSSTDDDLMGQATRCVRKFAPKGQKVMGKRSNGHITACKISDARPNEMIASWSGDHIYSFDLNGDLPQIPLAKTKFKSSGGRRVHTELKRKRGQGDGETPLSKNAKAVAQSRTLRQGGTALRVQYQNGQSEDIAIRDEPMPTPQQRDAHRLAENVEKLRADVFKAELDPSAVLSRAATVLEEMNRVMHGWRYPVDPSADVVLAQRNSRIAREISKRFVQAAGTLARVVGGRIRTVAGESPLLSNFIAVGTRTNDLGLPRRERFGYDFLKAILLWTESGVGRLIEGFTRPAGMSSTSSTRALGLPVPEQDASIEAVEDYIIPHLLDLASEDPVLDCTTNRFETEERRQLFQSETDAVVAFASAVKVPFADLLSAGGASSSVTADSQDRESTVQFWCQRVARGVLKNGARSVNFHFVSRAFGGVGRPMQESTERDDGSTDGEQHNESETGSTMMSSEENGELAPEAQQAERGGGASARVGTGFQPAQGHMNGEDWEESVVYEYDDDDDDDLDLDDASGIDEDDEDDTSDHADDLSENLDFELPRMISLATEASRRKWSRVGAGLPAFAATRSYRGHCNVRTVKDVNYLGPDDDYVVSGSDDGNFFIWDRKTGELVNVLEGDDDIVNVVQGHPYEPLVAVSGIDSTVKIFSPDNQAQQMARLGLGVSASIFRSAGIPRLGALGERRSAHRVQGSSTNASAENTSEPAERQDGYDDESEGETAPAPNGLASRRRMHDVYRITTQNDAMRESGRGDSFVSVSALQPLLLMLASRGVGGNEG